MIKNLVEKIQKWLDVWVDGLPPVSYESYSFNY